MTAEQIAENFESVRNQIKEAEKKSGRKDNGKSDRGRKRRPLARR